MTRILVVDDEPQILRGSAPGFSSRPRAVAPPCCRPGPQAAVRRVSWS
ncbi:hypothetical protein [Nonomuraea sp. GTA35]